MNADRSLERCKTYIDCQIHAIQQPARRKRPFPSGPAITISRQTGAGALLIAPKVGAYLDQHGPAGNCPWTVFDRSLVEKVLEEHKLPKDLAQFMTEDRRSYLDDVMEELVGLHPSSWTLVRKTTETILNLAGMGRVILVGRGANIITAKMTNVFHVRLVGSRDQRTERVMAYYKMSRKEAAQFIRKEDRGRERYLLKYFQRGIEDELLYHLVVNTDHVSHDDAAELIGDAALRLFKKAVDD